MSRTNPYKLKRRVASKTLLVYGEGLSEEVFFKHLRGIYAYGNNVAVTVRKGQGGTADKVVIEADNTPGDFDRKVVIVDNDKTNLEMEQARKEAKNRQIELLENVPCLEATLLSILNKGSPFSSKSSDWCKSEFESKFISKKKRSEISEYKRLFTKIILDEQRPKILELNRLIELMEGH